MNHYLALSDYEINLINSGLLIMMTKNAKNSLTAVQVETKQYHEMLSLELFELCSKVKLLNVDRYLNLSKHELSLIKKSLRTFANFIYQKSLKDKGHAKYYESCNLQLISTRGKINTIESIP